MECSGCVGKRGSSRGLVSASEASQEGSGESAYPSVYKPPRNESLPRMDQNFSQETITLRLFNLSDATSLIEWASDERIMRFSTWKPCTTREAAADFIQSYIMPHPWFRSICVTGRSVGFVMVHPVSNEESRRASIGYALAHEFWGRGIATAVVKKVVGQIFDEWSQLERLEALVVVENVRSQRVLEKAGFVKEGILRSYRVIQGKGRDMIMYSFLRTDSLHP
ncbi:Acyl-CoA N-acyltransferases (NAT) superfamily protein [Rhynchospora pubera]|uniref:Acyl-CoA N-acyltransferases (NAT) superfamily protein n=1 Tax=Rhynchospora pubera TaxID=906938 RepID=A0AAV8F3Y3_9POAL|nr:Acyl-CoA N-acyltransferases (NAT) superfamily protein [Rhynchospora pubera]